MPVTSTTQIAVPAANGNDPVAIDLKISPRFIPTGVTASAALTLQRYRLMPNGANGNPVKPLLIGAPTFVRIPDVYKAIAGSPAVPANGNIPAQEAEPPDNDLAAALNAIETAVQAYIVAKGL